MANDHGSWISLVPLGGADTVTGSCYMIKTNIDGKKKYYLVDCGLFSEKRADLLNTNISDLADKIDAIFVTHAHVDHIGRLPYLYKLGYDNHIYLTKPVAELSSIILNDSARIQEQEFKNFLRKVGIRNKPIINGLEVQPLYTVQDAEAVCKNFEIVERGKEIQIDESLTACFYNAGHSLGSCSIMLTFYNGTESYRIYFSGDIGQNNPILKRRVDSFKRDVDFVVMESTYADRIHDDREKSWSELREAVATTIINGGNVIFPAFAVGRTQELLYLYYKDMVENDDWVAEVFKKTPVFVDSYMAVQATAKFGKFISELKAAAAKLMRESCPFNFPKLFMLTDAEESKRLIEKNSSYIAFSAAGMCNAGRILYHLEKELPNPYSTIIFTGFQAEGTLGRLIVDGRKMVNIHGSRVDIHAKIVSVNAFSAHVDQNGLIDWLSRIENKGVVFLGHGEPTSQKVLKQRIADDIGTAYDRIQLMKYGEVYHLYKGGYDLTTFSVKRQSSARNTERTNKQEKEEIRAKNEGAYISEMLRNTSDEVIIETLLAIKKGIEKELKKRRFHGGKDKINKGGRSKRKRQKR